MQNPSRHAYLKQANALSPEEIRAWDQLSTSQPHIASPFMSAYFARAIAEAGVDARVCVIQDNEKISAFFPYLYESKWGSRFKVAQRVGGELMDTFGVVAEPGFRIGADELLRLANINYLNFSHLDETQLQHGLPGEQPRIGLRALLTPETAPVLNAAQSRHYTKDTARRLRKLTDEIGPIRFEFDVVENRSEQLEHLIAQKRAQYASSKAADSLGDEWKRKALFRLLDYKFDTCRGVLSTLYAGDKWIASHFGIMGNGILTFWFPVYNPEFSRYSPGRLLFQQIIKSCGEYGFTVIDRGEGDTPSKREITNHEYRLYRGVWQGKSALSPLIHNFHRIKWKLGM